MNNLCFWKTRFVKIMGSMNVRHKTLNGLLTLVLLVWVSVRSDAQTLALKTNVPLWGTATPNLALEAGLSSQWSLELSGAANPFSFNDNRKWKHYLLQGEARYWLCERFYGHFLGIHAGGGEFNVARTSVPWLDFSSGNRYEGWNVGAGISYGYSWVLGKRWNLEATLGLGWLHLDYDKFQCAACGKKLESKKEDRFAPTKIAVNLIYMIK